MVPAVVGRGARDAPRGAGFIVFAEVKPCGGPVDGDASPRALSMDIGGDALLALLLGAAREEEEEEGTLNDVPPLALDLLWAVLQRGQGLSKRAWHLQRVAVVDEKGGAYVARLFFGPPGGDDDDGAFLPPSSWELRCRPSDASWLALQADCPLYVRRDLFDARAAPLDVLLAAVDDDDDEGAASDSDDDDGTVSSIPLTPVEPPPPAVAHVASLSPGDPDGIVLLKRALALAVRDEDFATAARLRDHPAMAAYARAAAADAAGDVDGAAAARADVEAALDGRPRKPTPPSKAARAPRRPAAERGGRVRGRKPPQQPGGGSAEA